MLMPLRAAGSLLGLCWQSASAFLLNTPMNGSLWESFPIASESTNAKSGYVFDDYLWQSIVTLDWESFVQPGRRKKANRINGYYIKWVRHHATNVDIWDQRHRVRTSDTES